MSLRQLVRSQWPFVTVVLIFAVAFTLAAANFWRRGALLIGIGVGVAAALRLALAEDRAGLLVVRSKGIDFTTMSACRVSAGRSRVPVWHKVTVAFSERRVNMRPSGRPTVTPRPITTTCAPAISTW